MCVSESHLTVNDLYAERPGVPLAKTRIRRALSCRETKRGLGVCEEVSGIPMGRYAFQGDHGDDGTVGFSKLDDGLYVPGRFGSLAYGGATNVLTRCRSQAMYSEERWESLRSQFKETFYSVYGITSLPLLSLAVSAGLSTLKLSACLPTAPHSTPSQPSEIAPQDPNTAMVLSIPSLAAAPPVHVMEDITIDPALPMMTDPTPLHDHPEHPQRNIDCPTCAKDLSILAREVPFSHHVNSTLVCRISGEVMDDTNYPMTFPNGYVYSYNVSSIGARWRPHVLTDKRL